MVFEFQLKDEKVKVFYNRVAINFHFVDEELYEHEISKKYSLYYLEEFYRKLNEASEFSAPILVSVDGDPGDWSMQINVRFLSTEVIEVQPSLISGPNAKLFEKKVVAIDELKSDLDKLKDLLL